jgi:xanthine dehydrogenase accessory factor
MSRRSKMLVAADGSQRGTIGGGCLEADVHAMARLAMRSKKASLHRFTLTETKAGVEGLNCGGTVEILIEPLPAKDDAAAIEVYRQALAALEAREEAVMTTLVLDEDPPACRVLGKGIVGWKGLRAGTGPLAADAGLTEWTVEEALGILGQDRALILRAPSPAAPEGSRLFLETLDAPPTVYLFGGGHVSLAVARVARTAGFRIVVVDDRPAFANADRFPEADATLVLPMTEAVSRLPIDRTSFLVAVTRGHQHDEPVIEQAIRTPAAYIGMIGSRRKVELMWRKLKERGATDEQLSRVHAPIGLPIGGDSPGEIAVSIVAQMIQARRQGQK